MHLRKSKFRKRGRTSPKMYNTKLVLHCYDVVPKNCGNWNFQFPEPDLERRHSNEQVLCYTLCGEVLPLLRNLNFLRYIKWENARKPLFKGRKWADYLPFCHVTDLNSEQVSDFCFGHRKCLFWSEEKQWNWLFLILKTGASGARNENLRPVLKSGLWRGNMVRWYEN